MTKADAVRQIVQSRRLLAACHFNPDGDAIGSLLAVGGLVRALGKEVVLVCEDPVPPRYASLAGAEAVVSVEQAGGQGPFDTAIFVDCSDLARAGSAAELVDESMNLINIDHHVSNEGYGSANMIDVDAAATAEILVELFDELKAPIDADAASALYCGIMTDTGSFRFANTTPRSLAMASRLVHAGARPAALASAVYGSSGEQDLRALGRFLERMQTELEGRFAYSWIVAEELGADTEGYIDTMMTLETIEVGAFLRPIEEGAWKLSLRSVGAVNVAEIASTWGGGGHAKAAGARIEGTLEQAKAALRDAVLPALRRDP